MRTDAYYFGCHREAGHFLWREGMTHAWQAERDLPVPLRPAVLDGGYAPRDPKEEQGRAALHRVHDWTVIAFWDRSVDKRGACNSVFLFRPNTLTFDQAIEHAQAIFPEVWSRFTFPVVPV